MTLRVIGDVHERYNEYKKLLTIPSIQIGDMGFNYSPLDGVDPIHRYFPGNHDNPDGHPLCLGRYGVLAEKGTKIAYVGGGHSIDWSFRKLYRDWWPNEELSVEEQNNCLVLLKGFNPDIMLSHECPDYLSNVVSNPNILEQYGYPRDWISTTSRFLGMVSQVIQPKLWIFGHHHKRWSLKYDGCQYECLNMVGNDDCYLDLELI